VAKTSSQKIWPHSLKVLFEVRIMGPFSYLLEIIWNARLASDRLSGRYPTSSMMRTAGRV
jgi:hypothetical protein